MEIRHSKRPFWFNAITFQRQYTTLSKPKVVTDTESVITEEEAEEELHAMESPSKMTKEEVTHIHHVSKKEFKAAMKLVAPVRHFTIAGLNTTLGAMLPFVLWIQIPGAFMITLAPCALVTLVAVASASYVTSKILADGPIGRALFAKYLKRPVMGSIVIGGSVAFGSLLLLYVAICLGLYYIYTNHREMWDIVTDLNSEYDQDIAPTVRIAQVLVLVGAVSLALAPFFVLPIGSYTGYKLIKSLQRVIAGRQVSSKSFLIGRIGHRHPLLRL